MSLPAKDRQLAFGLHRKRCHTTIPRHGKLSLHHHIVPASIGIVGHGRLCAFLAPANVHATIHRSTLSTRYLRHCAQVSTTVQKEELQKINDDSLESKLLQQTYMFVFLYVFRFCWLKVCFDLLAQSEQKQRTTARPLHDRIHFAVLVLSHTHTQSC